MLRFTLLILAIALLPSLVQAQNGQFDVHIAVNTSTLIGNELNGDFSHDVGFTAGISYVDKPMPKLHIRFLLEYSMADYRYQHENRRGNLIRPSFLIEYYFGNIFLTAGPEASINMESSMKSESVQRSSVNHEVQTLTGNVVAGAGFRFSRRTAVFGKIHQGFTPYTRNLEKGYFQSFELGIYLGI